jgi:hypothetical protein
MGLRVNYIDWKEAIRAVVTFLNNGGNTPYVKQGKGTPESAVVGNVGDLFLRLDGGASTTLYVKESGAGTNTGWVAK